MLCRRQVCRVPARARADLAASSVDRPRQCSSSPSASIGSMLAGLRPGSSSAATVRCGSLRSIADCWAESNFSTLFLLWPEDFIASLGDDPSQKSSLCSGPWGWCVLLHACASLKSRRWSVVARCAEPELTGVGTTRPSLRAPKRSSAMRHPTKERSATAATPTKCGASASAWATCSIARCARRTGSSRAGCRIVYRTVSLQMGLYSSACTFSSRAEQG